MKAVMDAILFLLEHINVHNNPTVARNAALHVGALQTAINEVSDDTAPVHTAEQLADLVQQAVQKGHPLVHALRAAINTANAAHPAGTSIVGGTMSVSAASPITGGSTSSPKK